MIVSALRGWAFKASKVPIGFDIQNQSSPLRFDHMFSIKRYDMNDG